MKLNKSGVEVYNKWSGIYNSELEKLRTENNDPDFCEGWCIIDDDSHIHNIEDEIGLLIFGYDDNAIYHILDCIDDGFVGADDEWTHGVSSRQLIEMMKPYFNIVDKDDIEIYE